MRTLQGVEIILDPVMTVTLKNTAFHSLPLSQQMQWFVSR